MTNQNRKKEVLLIDDNPHDTLLTQEAFNDCKRDVNINIFHDGSEALGFLKKQGVHSSSTTPDLVLLDINMPRMSGIEVLQHIKNDDSLKSIPVVILSTSSNQDEIKKCYQLQANSYISKPISYFDLIEIVEHISHYWFDMNNLPTK